MKKIAISQSNYIPWIGYFELISFVDEFIFFDEVQYTKRDWRNWNKINSEKKTKWLTIPLKNKNNYLQKINKMQVCHNQWISDYLNQIKHNYKNYPNFKKKYIDY